MSIQAYYENSKEIAEAYNSGKLEENYPILAEAIKILLDNKKDQVATIHKE